MHRSHRTRHILWTPNFALTLWECILQVFYRQLENTKFFTISAPSKEGSPLKQSILHFQYIKLQGMPGSKVGDGFETHGVIVYRSRHEGSRKITV